MPVEEHTFQIHLEGLIRLLAQNLYADPDIFLREMIQNAHDSIGRRGVLAAERGETELPAPRIRVVVDREADTIEISDNGCGLTREEIDDYLSTIGQTGNTDELRHRIKEADRSRTVDLIGQFGIGLLSAFIVAEQVTLVTKAAGHQALRWESRGGENYQVEPGERAQVGTTVTLHLRTENHRYLDTGRLRSIIRTYADFIGMPVYLNNEADPANAVTAPWHRSYPSDRERHRAYYEFWEKKFLSETSLHVFAVDEAFDWDDVSQPDGKGHGRVQGVLAITDRHTPDVNARGTVDIYIKRMFISAGNRDVLPPWAKFLQGALECDELTPNAARDNVIRNAALAAVQQTLGWLIVRELTELSQRDHQRFIDIMRWHSYHLLAMSVVEDYEEFFRAVADLMPLESDQGPITVAEYLRTAPPRSDGSRLIYYITERGSANQYFLLASARSMRVFNCAEPFAERFLERYAQTWPERAHLHRLDVAGSETIFEPLTEVEQESFTELQAVYSLIFPDLRCVAKVSRFRPVEVPAVLTETRDGRSRREMEQISTNMSLPGYVRDLLKGFLHDQREPLTLHLNADNPTIQKLAARDNLRDEVSRQALVSLYNNALMLLARVLRVEDVQTMFEQYNQVIELMLSLSAERADFERDLHARQVEIVELLHSAQGDTTGLDPYVSCFVAMPFSDDRATSIYHAVRAVLEDHPYFWRVVRADDTVEQPGLWPNLKTKLLRAHCYVAILTGSLNPNVMIETGRMEALQRPLLLLRDVAAAELPANLNGLLYEELRTSGSDLIDEVRNTIVRQDRLRTLQGSRYLSEAALKRYAFMEGEVSHKIIRLFSTWEEFIMADADQVAHQIGANRLTVQAAQTSLKEAQ
jgi:molecular chaperone HtpG